MPDAPLMPARMQKTNVRSARCVARFFIKLANARFARFPKMRNLLDKFSRKCNDIRSKLKKKNSFLAPLKKMKFIILGGSLSQIKGMYT